MQNTRLSGSRNISLCISSGFRRNCVYYRKDLPTTCRIGLRERHRIRVTIDDSVCFLDIIDDSATAPYVEIPLNGTPKRANHANIQLEVIVTTVYARTSSTIEYLRPNVMID